MPGADHIKHAVNDLRIGVEVDLNLNFRVVKIKLVIDLKDIERQIDGVGLLVEIRAAEIEGLSPIVAYRGKLKYEICKEALDLVASEGVSLKVAAVEGIKRAVKAVSEGSHLILVNRF